MGHVICNSRHLEDFLQESLHHIRRVACFAVIAVGKNVVECLVILAVVSDKEESLLEVDNFPEPVNLLAVPEVEGVDDEVLGLLSETLSA